MTAEPTRPAFSNRLLDWTGLGLLYALLLAIPFFGARWLGEILPSIFHPIGRIVANAVVMPFFYLCLHLILRRFGARVQNFIMLVVLIYGIATYIELQRALRTGDNNAWFSAFVAAVYTLGFAALTINSLIAWRREKRAERLVAEREEAERQAEAFAKARQIGP